MIAITFFFILIYWYLIKNSGSQAVKRYNVVIPLLFFLVGGLRNAAIYGDTFGYVRGFIDLENMSLQDIAFEHPKDTFFYIASHYLHPVLFHNYTLWLLLIAAIYTYPMFKLVRDYSANPMWSWVLYVLLGYFSFGMAGLRQTVAMGFCFYSFLHLVKGEWGKSLIIIAIAYLFHGTALLFLLIFPFTRIKFSFNKYTILIYAVIMVVIGLYGTAILGGLTESLGTRDERYISYGEDMRGSTYTYMIQQLFVVLPSLYFLRNRFHEPKVALFAHISVIALLFISLSPVIAEMFRVSMYFSWANMVLFPMAMVEASKRDKRIPAIFISIIVIYLVFINKSILVPYFFWFQDASSITRFY